MTLFLDPPPPSSITSHVSMKLLYLLLKYFASHYPKTFYLTLASFSKPSSPRLIPRPMVPNQNVTCSTPLPPKRHNDVIMEKIVWRRPLTMHVSHLRVALDHKTIHSLLSTSLHSPLSPVQCFLLPGKCCHIYIWYLD